MSILCFNVNHFADSAVAAGHYLVLAVVCYVHYLADHPVVECCFVAAGYFAVYYELPVRPQWTLYY